MATVPTYSQTLSTFVSSTLDEHQKGVIDQIWSTTDMLAYFSSRRKPQAGGKSIFVPLEYGKNTSITKGLGRGSKMDMVMDEIITEAQYFWQTYGGSVIRFRDDELENSGKYQVFNIVQAYINNMIKSFQEVLEQDLLADNDGTNGFAGLKFLIEDATNNATDSSVTAGSNTVGGINRASAGNEWWSNWGRNMTGKEPSIYLTYYMREAVNNIRTFTGRDPEVMLTHYVVRDLYEDEVQETLRTSTVQMGDIGIRAVEWKGIPFITSPYMDTTRIYFIGQDALEMYYEPRMWFKSTPWKEPTQQPFDFARQTLAKGQLTIKKPRATHVLYNINA